MGRSGRVLTGESARTVERSRAQAPVAGRRPDSLQALQHALGNRGVQEWLQVDRGPAVAVISKTGWLYGADFSKVRLFPDSPRLSGNRHALTEGEDLHFAKGRFAPGTAVGDRLIAHELAHVVQQRRGGAAGGAAAEVDASRAAESALRRVASPPVLGAPLGVAQHFEAWEHREIGDDLDGYKHVIVLPNGASLTYGEVVALAGDFYRSPEALFNAPRMELDKVFFTMKQEEAEATPRSDPDHPGLTISRPTAEQRVADDLAYDEATKDRGKGPRRLHREHPESDPPPATAGYSEMANENDAHFAPDNIQRNWAPLHAHALWLALKAWRMRTQGTGFADARRARRVHALENQAWLFSAFADHFLSDAFAAGHLVSGNEGRKRGRDFYDGHNAALQDAIFACALTDHAGHLFVSLVIDPEVTIPALVLLRAVVTVLFWRLDSFVPSLLLKTVHDKYNADGLEVKSALDEEQKDSEGWTTVGDAHLGDSNNQGATRRRAALASRAARDEVEDVLKTGTSTRSQAALKYVPKSVRLPGGAWQSVAEFSKGDNVYQPILELSLSSDPSVNRLYRIMKAYATGLATALGKTASVGFEEAFMFLATGVEKAGTAAATEAAAAASVARAGGTIDKYIEKLKREFVMGLPDLSDDVFIRRALRESGYE